MIEPKDLQNVGGRVIAGRGTFLVRVDDGEPVRLEHFRFYDFLIRRALISHAEPPEVGAERT